MLELGIITDEICDDLSRSVALAAAWGLDVIELRTVNGRNLLQLADDEVSQVERAVRDGGLPVSAIASPVFKSPRDGKPREIAADFAVPGSESVEAQLELLERACALAERVGARTVRVFTFWREPATPDVVREVVDHLARAAEVAAAHDLTLAIENEPVCTIASGRELGALCSELLARLSGASRDHVGALWDPGNALVAGEARPYPDGFAALSGCPIRHVHLKDVRPGPAGPTFVPLGEGAVAYAPQLDALLQGGYRGMFVLEPHVKPDPRGSREAGAKACVDAARRMLDDARSRTGI